MNNADIATTNNTPSAPVSALSARYTLLLGLALGLHADSLLWDYDPTPLTLLLLLTGFAIGALILGWYNKSEALQAQALCSIAVLACAMLMVWRTTPIIGALMLLCILALLALFILRRGGLPWRHSEPHHAITVALTVLVAIVNRNLLLLQAVSQDRRSADTGMRHIVQGILLAVPLVIVFGQLFVAADASFARWAAGVDWLSPSLPFQLLFVLAFGWFASSLVALAWQPVRFDGERFRFTPGATEVNIALAALSILFVVFAGFQLASLFSPAAANVARSGLGIAEYARHGFFQLIWIAALALGVLAAFASCYRQHWYRRLGALLLSCVVIVLASAVQRMQYYLQSYGLSVDRVIASTVMLWLALNVVVFAATVLRQRPGGILAAAAWQGVALSMALALANPAALVVHANVARAQQSQQPLDLGYLLSLEADAVPALIHSFASLDTADQCRAAITLIDRWWDTERRRPDNNWRYWQAGHHNAVQAVRTNANLLQQAAARSGHPYYRDMTNFSLPQREAAAEAGCR